MGALDSGMPENGLRFVCLGSGTSYGVPMVGCTCPVCCSDDPRNRRTRCSALVTDGAVNVLIDTSTDLRIQALREGITRVDAVCFTHSHADHLHGIDDLRGFSIRTKRPIPAFGNALTLQQIRTRYDYMFSDPDFRLGWGIPRLELRELGTSPVRIGSLEVVPVPLFHGALSVLGYRIGQLAYLTDCSAIPDGSLELLRGLDTLVIDGLRQRPHPTHFSIGEALEVIEHLSPRRAFLTHLTHDVDHATVESGLPGSVRLAYDGLVVDISSFSTPQT